MKLLALPDIDIFKTGHIDIDIFKKCRYIDNRYGLSIYRTPLVSEVDQLGISGYLWVSQVHQSGICRYRVDQSGICGYQRLINWLDMGICGYLQVSGYSGYLRVSH